MSAILARPAAAPPAPPIPALERPLSPDALEHALRAFHSSYYVEHPFHVERARAADEGEIARHAGVVHRKHVQPPESAEQDDGCRPRSDALDPTEKRGSVVTLELLQHRLVERASGEHFADAPERRELPGAEARRVQQVTARAQHCLAWDALSVLSVRPAMTRSPPLTLTGFAYRP